MFGEKVLNFFQGTRMIFDGEQRAGEVVAGGETIFGINQIKIKTTKSCDGLVVLLFCIIAFREKKADGMNILILSMALSIFFLLATKQEINILTVVNPVITKNGI